MSTLNRRETDRGFIIYHEFVDTYGSAVRVQESSAASGPHLWIFCESAEGTKTPHLNVEQARAVRDAIDVFLKEIPERWE